MIKNREEYLKSLGARPCTNCGDKHLLTDFAAIVPANVGDTSCNLYTEMHYYCHKCWHEEGIAERYQS